MNMVFDRDISSLVVPFCGVGMLALLVLSSAFASDSVIGFSPWNGVEFGLNRNEATVGGRAAASLGVCHGLTLSGAVTVPVGVIGDSSGSTPSGDGTYTGSVDFTGISARSAVVDALRIVSEGILALQPTKTGLRSDATAATDESQKATLHEALSAIEALEKRHLSVRTKLASCLASRLGNPADVYTPQASDPALPVGATVSDVLNLASRVGGDDQLRARAAGAKTPEDLAPEFAAIDAVLDRGGSSVASESEVADITEKVGKALDYLEEVAVGGATTLATAEALSEDLWSTGGTFDVSHERVGGTGIGTQIEGGFTVAWQAEARVRLDLNLGLNAVFAEGTDPALGVPMKLGFEAFTKAKRLRGIDGSEVPYLLYVSVQADGQLAAESTVDFGLVASTTAGFKSPDGGATLGLGLQLSLPGLEEDPEFAPVFVVSGVFGGTGEG